MRLDPIKLRVVQEAMKEVPFSGWTINVLREACYTCGVEDQMSILFPDGINSLVEAYCQYLDEEMLKRCLAEDLTEMRVHQKVKFAILKRLEVMMRYKAVASKTVSFLAFPMHAALATRTTWRVVDVIWREVVKDKSTDFNYYTKRGLLAGVYVSTLIYWLADDSPEHEATERFLEARIRNVLTIGKGIHQIKEKAKSFID
jgi:ubiquinone biosynthesis protein COQ9